MVNKLNTIKFYRMNKNLTQEETARQANISLSYYQKIESGKSVPNVYLAITLSKLFNVPIDVLFQN